MTNQSREILELKRELESRISENEKKINQISKYFRFCKYKQCGNLILQIGKKPKNFCNKKCYNKFQTENGYYAKTMQKHLKLHPETYEKNRIRMDKYYKDNIQKPKIDSYCVICGKLCPGRRKKYCSPECVKIGKKRYMEIYTPKYYQEHKKPKLTLFCLECEKLLVGTQRKYCSTSCRNRHYWNIPENKERRRKNKIENEKNSNIC